MSKVIKDNLMTAFEELTPDCFDEIIARIDADETIDDEALVQDIPPAKASRRVLRYTLVPAAAAAICAISFGLNATADDSIGTLYIDVNPSISISYDKEGLVNDILAENEDGADLLEDIDVRQYKDMELSDSVNMVLTQLDQDGYFEDSTADLIISNCLKETSEDNAIDESINETITSYAQDNSLDATWVSQSFEDDDALTSTAMEEQVSVGKYYFLQHITENTGIDVTGLKDESVKNIYAYLYDAQIDLTTDDSITLMHVAPDDNESKETQDVDDSASTFDDSTNSDHELKEPNTQNSSDSSSTDTTTEDSTQSDSLDSDHEETDSIANPPATSDSSDNKKSDHTNHPNTPSESGNATTSDQPTKPDSNSKHKTNTPIAITNTVVKANGNISIRFSESAYYSKYYKAIVQDDDGNVVETSLVKKTKHRLVLNATDLEDDTTYTILIYGVKSNSQTKAKCLSTTFTLELSTPDASTTQASSPPTDSGSIEEETTSKENDNSELP
ncbi:anti-sigma-I factor RsgI family protein [Eubacterium oxidoreducens]|uniref:Anti-sigma factor RsgI-like middle domain-containing protein n=1 Tax=Eubacterium oxidoreducens TaxID=1732 RepID=A0A1G6CSG7_EUBOX|nr:hypothetical protein [Eubacterium oxidoreducens]SDB35784.1 hypothetical protein SAMN02910417_02635 [Eubacterium oxidoreducens]